MTDDTTEAAPVAAPEVPAATTPADESIGAEIGAFVHDDIVVPVETFYEDIVKPDAEAAAAFAKSAVEAWAAQFETDFGKAAVAAVAAFLTTVGSGGTNVLAVASAAGAALVAAGVSIATADAQTVLLNAARTLLNPPALSADDAAAPAVPAT